MATAARRSLVSLVLSKTQSCFPKPHLAHAPPPLLSRPSFAALGRQRPGAAAPLSVPARPKTTSSGSGYSPLRDSSPNFSNRPPKETILLDGCDYEHWLIVMEFPENPKPSEEEMVAAYVKTLSTVVGSEEEAKKKIYSVCTTTYTGFGALISEEVSYKLKGLPGVLWVLPDSYLDVPNKDYGAETNILTNTWRTYLKTMLDEMLSPSGDLFIDGKVIHRPQFRFNERQQTRSRPRPRYDRRRESMQVERRETMQRGAWTQEQSGNVSQQMPGNSQPANPGGLPQEGN